MTSLTTLLAAAFVLSSISGGTVPTDGPPAVLSGATVIAAQDVEMAQASGAAIIDVRRAADYAAGHIKGALNVPYGEKSQRAPSFDATEDTFNRTMLPSDRTRTVVIYCDAPDCWKGFKAASVAVKDGYTRVLWYRLGFAEWQAKGFAVE